MVKILMLFIIEFDRILKYAIFESDHVKITLQTVLVLIIILTVTHFLLKFIRLFATKHLDEEDTNRFITVFTFLKYIIFTVAIITTLDASGVNITAILAASTALFVGLGLGLQKFFQDIISGVFILMDRTVTVNDIIEIQGKVGRVTKVNLRTTKAITHDDKILVIPNHKFLTEILYNWTQNSEITRESVSVGVAYNSDVNLVKALLLGIAIQEEAILNEPQPNVFFEDFGDSSLNFVLHFYIDDSFSVPLIKSNLRFKFFKSFKENQINIPFPQREITVFNSRLKE